MGQSVKHEKKKDGMLKNGAKSSPWSSYSNRK
jgi:hypothetical protein